MLHAWLSLALSLRSVGTSSVYARSPATFTLLDVCLELEPDCSFKEKQEPFGHGHWLVRLEPAREVALKPVVCSLETERESHEVGAYACFTEVEKLLAILDQLIRYSEGVQRLESFSHAHIVNQLQLCFLFRLLSLFSSFSCREIGWPKFILRWSICLILFVFWSIRTWVIGLLFVFLSFWSRIAHFKVPKRGFFRRWCNHEEEKRLELV